MKLDLSGFKYLETREIEEEMKRLQIQTKTRGIDMYYLKYRGTAIADKVPDFKILLEARKDRATPW